MMNWEVEGIDEQGMCIYREEGQYLTDMLAIVKKAVEIHGCIKIVVRKVT
jgi:hypothetical protein